MEESDLGYSSVTMKPRDLYAKFEVEWNKELKKPPKHRNLISAIIRALGVGYWSVAIILNVVATILTMVPTVILNLFVGEIERDEVSNDLVCCVSRR